MRDAFKGRKRSTEAVRPQPRACALIICLEHRLGLFYGVGGMGQRESAATWARLGSVAWAVEIPPPLGVAWVGGMGRKPMWTTIDDDGDGDDGDGRR